LIRQTKRLQKYRLQPSPRSYSVRFFRFVHITPGYNERCYLPLPRKLAILVQFIKITYHGPLILRQRPHIVQFSLFIFFIFRVYLDSYRRHLSSAISCFRPKIPVPTSYRDPLSSATTNFSYNELLTYGCALYNWAIPFFVDAMKLNDIITKPALQPEEDKFIRPRIVKITNYESYWQATYSLFPVSASSMPKNTSSPFDILKPFMIHCDTCSSYLYVREYFPRKYLPYSALSP